MGKSAPIKILFWLEISKNGHSRGRRLRFKCPCPEINVPLYKWFNNSLTAAVVGIVNYAN